MSAEEDDLKSFVTAVVAVGPIGKSEFFRWHGRNYYIVKKELGHLRDNDLFLCFYDGTDMRALAFMSVTKIDHVWRTVLSILEQMDELSTEGMMPIRAEIKRPPKLYIVKPNDEGEDDSVG